MNLDYFIEQQKNLIKTENNIEKFINDNCLDFENNFYFHISCSTPNDTFAFANNIETEISFNFYIPFPKNNNMIKIISISASFDRFDNRTNILSNNFFITQVDTHIDIKTKFLLLNGQNLIEAKFPIFKLLSETLESNSSNFKICNGLDYNSLQKYNTRTGNLVDFLIHIKETKIHNFLKTWNINGFKVEANNFNKVYDKLIESLNTKTNLNKEILGLESFNKILSISDAHETIKNHYDLEKKLDSKLGYSPAKKI